METLSFAFGVLTIIAVGLITVVVVGMVKVIKMQRHLDGLEKWVNDSDTNLIRKISDNSGYFDQQIETLNRELTTVISDDRRELNHRIDEVYRYTDSRFDKMENKINERFEAARKILDNASL